MKKEHFIYIGLILMLFTSCMGSKKVIENNTSKKETEKFEVKKDSSNIVEKNKSISDKLDLAVSKSKTNDADFNKKVDAKVDEILAKLNTTKTSGDNSYKLYYNLLKRQVEFEAKIGETQNETKETNTKETSEKTLEEKTDEYISKKITAIPWWLWFVALLYLLPTIIDRISLLINPLKVLTSKFKK